MYVCVCVRVPLSLSLSIYIYMTCLPIYIIWHVYASGWKTASVVVPLYKTGVWVRSGGAITFMLFAISSDATQGLLYVMAWGLGGVGWGNSVHVTCNLKSMARQMLGRLKRLVQKWKTTIIPMPQNPVNTMKSLQHYSMFPGKIHRNMTYKMRTPPQCQPFFCSKRAQPLARFPTPGCLCAYMISFSLCACVVVCAQCAFCASVCDLAMRRGHFRRLLRALSAFGWFGALKTGRGSRPKEQVHLWSIARFERM